MFSLSFFSFSSLALRTTPLCSCSETWANRRSTSDWESTSPALAAGSLESGMADLLDGELREVDLLHEISAEGVVKNRDQLRTNLIARAGFFEVADGFA